MKKAVLFSPRKWAKIDMRFLLAYKELVYGDDCRCIKLSVNHIEKHLSLRSHRLSSVGLGLFCVKKAVNTSKCHVGTVLPYD